MLSTSDLPRVRGLVGHLNRRQPPRTPRLHPPLLGRRPPGQPLALDLLFLPPLPHLRRPRPVLRRLLPRRQPPSRRAASTCGLWSPHLVTQPTSTPRTSRPRCAASLTQRCSASSSSSTRSSGSSSRRRRHLLRSTRRFTPVRRARPRRRQAGMHLQPRSSPLRRLRAELRVARGPAPPQPRHHLPPRLRPLP